MADLATNARGAYDLVREGAWIDAGLRAGTDLGPLSQVLRPVDTLNQAGLGWLSGYLQPHQETLDQLAGNAAVIRTFAETWQTVATQVAEIQHQLAGSATADTAQWQGSAADKYRTSAAGLANAVAGSSTLSAAVASVANEMGEAAAAARRSVADQVADLVQQLIQQVGPAAAVGGVTPAADHPGHRAHRPVPSADRRLPEPAAHHDHRSRDRRRQHRHRPRHHQVLAHGVRQAAHPGRNTADPLGPVRRGPGGHDAGRRAHPPAPA